MADRFNGTIQLGGRISREVFQRCVELCEHLLEGDFEEGAAYFCECTQDDFQELIQYCKDNGVSLSLLWEAKYEFDAQVDYWIDGNAHQYLGTNEGDIAVRLSDLENAKDMTVREFIDSLRVPEFPELEIIDDQVVE